MTPPLTKQIWEFMQDQLELSKKREMTVGTFVTSANENTNAGFCREHAKGELKTGETYKISRFLSPCWEKKYMGRIFYAGNTVFETFIQDLLSMSINLLLALCLVSPRYLFSMGPAYKISRVVETLRVDWYLTLIFLTHGNLAVFHRLMKYVDPLSVRKAHPSLETYSYKRAAGLKTLLVEEVSPSAEAVSEKSLKETAPIVLARWKTTL